MILNLGVSYRTAEYAAEEYYIKTFKNAIEKLIECYKDQLQNISDIVYSNSNNESDPRVYRNCADLKNIFKTKSEVILEKKIGAIDEALNSEPRKKQFYQCFQDFKNAVFNVKIKNANYPKKATNIDTNGTKDLSIKEKKKILQLKDINFINKIQNFNEEWLRDYTGYNLLQALYNRGPSDCMDDIRKNYSENIFSITKLSYQYSKHVLINLIIF
ncbi:uncharacterized protein LOC132944685 [Metopolophium dirhodum]|uniref:uncharacterized protein LOC132944685 n=1 Tax=Metopolophium dirhodum TaxID=44670 RepID=UPI00298F7406|nr:uncharacterized protein LOC132944685 [Metopolophium dirhodum]